MQDFIREIKELLAKEHESSVPVPPPPSAQRVKYKMEWMPSPVPRTTETAVSLKDARYDLSWTLFNYATEKGTKIPILIAKAQPGLGKTYGALSTAQLMADEGKRVLYLMPTHAHYDTLQQFAHFRPELWYHWKGYNAPLDGGDDSELMCRYGAQAGKWMNKGYPLMGMCDSLCSLHKTNCAYRQQALMPEKIIAGVHEHAVTGLSISKFDLVIIDELPLRAFLSPRTIPLAGIATEGAVGPIAELQMILLKLAASGKTIQGKELMTAIAEPLGDVFAQFEMDLLPSLPYLLTEDDVDKAGYWYITDLLKLLVGEWKAYESGAEEWLNRVIIHGTELRLLLRGKAWKKLPKRVIVVDATANGEMYQQMFPERTVKIYRPNVEMKGSIRQITHRYNGITTIVGKKQGAEAVELVRTMIAEKGYKNPAVITFKGAEAAFAEVVGTDRVGHFYGQRGSNSFQDADGLFVVGTPSPADIIIMRDVATLNQARINKFSTTLTKNGGIIPIRSIQLGWYQAWDKEGNQACRYISGFRDNDLRAMSDTRREEELIQAVHRARPLIRPCDIWLMSSIPIDVPLTAIYDSPEEAMGVPNGIHWSNWVKLRPWILARNEPFNIEDIAEAIGVSIHTVRIQKWMYAIHEHYSDQLEITCLSPLTIDKS